MLKQITRFAAKLGGKAYTHTHTQIAKRLMEKNVSLIMKVLQSSKSFPLIRFRSVRRTIQIKVAEMLWTSSPYGVLFNSNFF